MADNSRSWLANPGSPSLMLDHKYMQPLKMLQQPCCLHAQLS